MQTPCEVSAQHAFQYRAEEEAEQGAQSRLQSLPVSLPPKSSPIKAPKNGRVQCPGHEEQPMRVPARHPRVPQRVPPLYLLPAWDEIVEHLYDDDNQQPQQQLGGRVLHLVGEVQQQQTGIGHGRTGNYGQETACQSRYQAEDTHQNEKDV